jgi:hypothetical protein
LVYTTCSLCGRNAFSTYYLTELQVSKS